MTTATHQAPAAEPQARTNAAARSAWLLSKSEVAAYIATRLAELGEDE